MFHALQSFFRGKTRKTYTSIDPDEIFLDSKNLPEFDTDQFEGRIEQPISRSVFGFIFVFIFICGFILVFKLWNLQVTQGAIFRTRSDENSLHKTTIYADRGRILDRNGVPFVWNTLNPDSTDFSLRVYATSTGLSTVLGYVKYPSKDSSGFYYQNEFDPKDGIEKIDNQRLSGINGTKIIETDVRGRVTSESVVNPPRNGSDITLSIDERLQKQLYASLLDVANNRASYKGGAGVIMDVHTGEILASANFPEYESQTMTDGSNSEKINSWLQSSSNPFLNRVVDGLYTPGSIIKIFVAMGVLDQKVIDPSTQILSTGSISVPNPYSPDKPSVFLDWKAHGLVDLRRAIAVSSNVYFYEVGGGYKNQKGIGIYNIEKYTRMFGFGTTTGVEFPGEKKGTIPDPEWKKIAFKGEDWRIGDTYNTAIGQYGFQVSPLQVVRGVGAIANEGTLLVPTFEKGKGGVVSGQVGLDKSFYTIVKEGMRQGVNGGGTSHVLDVPFVELASKTGTAQIGIANDMINSWVVGFWPYKDPHYAYAVVMERGSKTNQFGATLVMKDMLDWMGVYGTDFLK